VANTAARQQSFEVRTWGGRREGAGRKIVNARPALRHRAREELSPYQPVHVTLRMAEHVWNLRSQRSFEILHGALDDVRRQPDVRVTHYSIQGNHVHLIVEASGTRALANGIRALTIRLARRLNEMMRRSGPVFEDRFHAHILRTPSEVRNALRYVLCNFAGHAQRRGERVPKGWVDPFTSAVVQPPRAGQRPLWPEAVTSEPETWLLRTAVSVDARNGGLAGR
jgi:REP element-mobilizing transposase RayT